MTHHQIIWLLKARFINNHPLLSVEDIIQLQTYTTCFCFKNRKCKCKYMYVSKTKLSKAPVNSTQLWNLIGLIDHVGVTDLVFKLRSHLSSVSAAQLWWHLLNLNVIYCRQPVLWWFWKIRKNNGTKEIGLVPPTSGYWLLFAVVLQRRTHMFSFSTQIYIYLWYDT